VNVTKSYASGLQQLTELNVQTVKTVFEESASTLKAGSNAKPGEFLSRRSTLFAAIPEKAAAYTRHFSKIVRATEADILNEARTQFEQYGFGMKGVFESAAQQAQSAVQGQLRFSPISVRHRLVRPTKRPGLPSTRAGKWRKPRTTQASRLPKPARVFDLNVC
jgi:phasin family protein